MILGTRVKHLEYPPRHFRVELRLLQYVSFSCPSVRGTSVEMRRIFLRHESVIRNCLLHSGVVSFKNSPDDKSLKRNRRRLKASALISEIKDPLIVSGTAGG